MRKPILAICYGTQSLNVWRNGTLVQHIESPVQHARTPGAPRTEAIEHPAEVDLESGLAKLTGRSSITVNSSHHQSVAIPGDALRVVARSPEDGIIEAVEGITREHWVLGVQWHPERNFERNEVSRHIFEKLIAEARAWHRRLALHCPDFESARVDE
jgi:putative glutamine amidotransferase